MTQEDPQDPTEQQQIEDLARRAEPLIGRRAMISKAGRLALPVLVTFFVSRDAMAQSGSAGSFGGMGGMGGMHGMDGMRSWRGMRRRR